MMTRGNEVSLVFPMTLELAGNRSRYQAGQVSGVIVDLRNSLIAGFTLSEAQVKIGQDRVWIPISALKEID